MVNYKGKRTTSTETKRSERNKWQGLMSYIFFSKREG
jgi:hypothetical protein